MSISVFSNFKIDDQIRYERLKVSFKSFYDFGFENWVINIRGNYRNQVYDYLYQNIPKHKLDISVQDYSVNWFFDSRKMFKKIKGDYIFIWNEDHMNVTDKNNFYEIFSEIKKNDIDQFKYTWFHNGNDVKLAKLADFKEGKKIIYDNYTYKKHSRIIYLTNKHKIKSHTYIVSLTSIFEKKLFKKILFTNDPLIKRWKEDTPFDFEKCPYDIHWLPIKIAYPKSEFFASIDDNHGQDGYCLIDRGLVDKHLKDENKSNFKKKNYTFKNFVLYPIRITRVFLREIINYSYSRLVYLFRGND